MTLDGCPVLSFPFSIGKIKISNVSFQCFYFLVGVEFDVKMCINLLN